MFQTQRSFGGIAWGQLRRCYCAHVPVVQVPIGWPSSSLSKSKSLSHCSSKLVQRVADGLAREGRKLTEVLQIPGHVVVLVSVVGVE